MHRPWTTAAYLVLWACGFAAGAQSLTVHVVDAKTGKPLKGAPVSIRYNFLEPRKARKGEVLEQKTDSDGKALFESLQMPAGGFSVSVFSMGYLPNELEPVFFPSASKAQNLQNPTHTQLPAEVTIRAHKTSFLEKLHLIYPGP